MAETVTVEALTLHSYNGQDRAPGTAYEIAADLADSIVAQGKAKRVEQAAKAKPAPTSKPVAPMTTNDLRTTEVTRKRKTSLGAKRKK